MMPDTPVQALDRRGGLFNKKGFLYELTLVMVVVIRKRVSENPLVMKRKTIMMSTIFMTTLLNYAVKEN